MEKKINILIVDDDEATRHVVSLIVEKLGYNPVVCVTGNEAISAIETENISLVLLDIMMPEMDGYEVLKHLRASKSFGDKPVIMITAKAQEEDIYSGYKSGADYYLTKPFTTKQLEESIKLYI